MPTYVPVIINNTTPPIEVTGVSGISYQSILNSLGNWNYLVNQIYIAAKSMSQIFQNLSFYKYDSTGNTDNQEVISDPDPYQKVPSIYLDTKGRNIVLDGRSSITMNILANESMTFVLDCDEVDVRSQLECYSKIPAAQNDIHV